MHTPGCSKVDQPCTSGCAAAGRACATADSPPTVHEEATQRGHTSHIGRSGTFHREIAGMVRGQCTRYGLLLNPNAQMPSAMLGRGGSPPVSPNVSHPLCADACKAAWGVGAEGALAAGAAGVCENSSRSIKLPASDVVRTVSEYPCPVCYAILSALSAVHFLVISNTRKL